MQRSACARRTCADVSRTLLLTLALGLAIGVVMGLTGAGGGVLAVPALVFGLGLTLAQAAPISMVGVSLAATVGTIEGLRRGTVRWRAAIYIALMGWPLSALGVALAQRLPDLVLRVIFVLVLAFVAWRQLRARAARERTAAAVEREAMVELNPQTGRFIWDRRAFGNFAAIGAVTGFMSGLLGVSGGFVLVPMLSRVTRLDPASMVGTSLMVGALVTGFGALASVAQGVPVAWPVAGWFAGALVAGLLVARAASRRLPVRTMQDVFIALVVGVALAMAADVVRRLIQMT
jgi:uncharacterized membrane protein YfcA